MVIGIIGAMEEEVAALKEAMEIQEVYEKAAMTFCKTEHACTHKVKHHFNPF